MWRERSASASRPRSSMAMTRSSNEHGRKDYAAFGIGMARRGGHHGGPCATPARAPAAQIRAVVHRARWGGADRQQRARFLVLLPAAQGGPAARSAGEGRRGGTPHRGIYRPDRAPDRLDDA